MSLFAALLRKLVVAATTLVAGGDGTMHDVDWCWRIVNKCELGPFGLLKAHWAELLLDEFGLHVDPPRSETFIEQIRDFLRGQT